MAGNEMAGRFRVARQGIERKKILVEIAEERGKKRGAGNAGMGMVPGPAGADVRRETTLR